MQFKIKFNILINIYVSFVNNVNLNKLHSLSFKRIIRLF